jgi:hypothetical protein
LVLIPPAAKPGCPERSSFKLDAIGVSMSNNSEEDAFPARMRSVVKAVVPHISLNQLRSPLGGFFAKIQGEQVYIPGRVYYLKDAVLRCALRGDLETQVALCLGARHHDGYLRESCLREIIGFDLPWVVPFVVPLIGEYVVEIVSFIEENENAFNSENYRNFASENSDLMAAIRCRAISYWDAYYRDRYPEMCEYPAIRIIDKMEKLYLIKVR